MEDVYLEPWPEKMPALHWPDQVAVESVPVVVLSELMPPG
jgi:hypothetical protein